MTLSWHAITWPDAFSTARLTASSRVCANGLTPVLKERMDADSSPIRRGISVSAGPLTIISETPCALRSPRNESRQSSRNRVRLSGVLSRLISLGSTTNTAAHSSTCSKSPCKAGLLVSRRSSRNQCNPLNVGFPAVSDQGKKGGSYPTAFGFDDLLAGKFKGQPYN